LGKGIDGMRAMESYLDELRKKKLKLKSSVKKEFFESNHSKAVRKWEAEKM